MILPIPDTKIANFKPGMKQINGSKLVFIVTLGAAINEEPSTLVRAR